MIPTTPPRPLTPATAERVVRICGLLTSNYAGEVANAASLATRIFEEHGWSWEQVVRTGIAAPPPPQPHHRPAPPPQYRPVDWRAAATACLRRADLLTAWEQDFVASLRGFQRLSPKQEALLARLVERVFAATGGAP
jgi:hypothetical protein